ncbi:CHASE sensor domain-containing protein, partial [Escherichia sp. TWPC-MK]
MLRNALLNVGRLLRELSLSISMTSIFITMMLIWLLLSVTSVLTLKQYAQKNLALTAATMTYSLEAAVVFADGPALPVFQLLQG